MIANLAPVSWFASLGSRAIRDRVIVLLLFLSALGLYCTTTGGLAGYEPQTAGAAEGIVKLGEPKLVIGSPIYARQLDYGKPYSHTQIAQPLLEAPFYWLGQQIDNAVSGGHAYTWRYALLRFYNPTMGAITVVAIFLLLRLRRRTQRQALAVAALATGASLIWPYSKIGMETTMMAMVALMLLGAFWAIERPAPERFALTGLAAGAAAASKPIGILMLAGLLAFIGPVRALPRRQRAISLACFAVPLLIWIAAIGWYNAYRTGSVTNFDQLFAPAWSHLPISFFGLLISPGKGLLWFSPLVILGGLGMSRLWREDRLLAFTIALAFGVNLVAISGTQYWADDTWGPRYLVPTAWLLVLPLAWWVRGRGRWRTTAAVAAIALVVQFAGVFVVYGASISFARSFSGEPVYLYGGYPQTAVAYGDDAPAWVPDLSEIRLQLELLAAWVKEQITGTGFKIHYTPYWGRPTVTDLRHPARFVGQPIPDFWWHIPGEATGLQGLAVAIAVMGLGAGALLARIAIPRRVRRPLPSAQPRTISSS